MSSTALFALTGAEQTDVVVRLLHGTADAPAIDRLVAFLGRSASAGDTATTHTA